MIEIEKTYLARCLPDLEGCQTKELYDIYFPKEAEHAHLRARKNGDRFEMTKKHRLNPEDSSTLIEETIELTKEEFEGLATGDGKRVRKIRHYLPYHGMMLEVDVFQDDLKGLVLIDVEFETEQQKDEFELPDFCLTEVTHADFLAGGMLSGKKYEDFEDRLIGLGYARI